MIRKFKHKGLRRLYEEDNAKGVQADHADRLRGILTNLDVATQPMDLELPGYKAAPAQGCAKRRLVDHGLRKLARDVSL